MDTRQGPQPEISEAVKSGDRLTALIALRDYLAERLDSAKSTRDIASITRQLRLTIAEIDSIEQGNANNSELDALKSRFKLKPIKAAR